MVFSSDLFSSLRSIHFTVISQMFLTFFDQFGRASLQLWFNSVLPPTSSCKIRTTHTTLYNILHPIVLNMQAVRFTEISPIQIPSDHISPRFHTLQHLDEEQSHFYLAQQLFFAITSPSSLSFNFLILISKL